MVLEKLMWYLKSPWKMVVIFCMNRVVVVLPLVLPAKWRPWVEIVVGSLASLIQEVNFRVLQFSRLSKTDPTFANPARALFRFFVRLQMIFTLYSYKDYTVEMCSVCRMRTCYSRHSSYRSTAVKDSKFCLILVWLLFITGTTSGEP